MFNKKQKRLLALDGGGIRGIITLHILKKIEDQLRPISGLGDKFRLRDFFDYIGGTSTGAIIAAGLALGRSAQELIDFYETDGPRMFRKSRLQRHYHKFSAEPLAALLKRELGVDTILELQQQQKLSRDKHLLVVTQNISSDSPWPLSTNPRAKYNCVKRRDCNLRIPLWQLVRASTAAPTYFEPQRIEFIPGDVSSRRFFEDGGVTPYNNPSFLLYRMATLPEYQCAWPDGERNMMLVSVGTGDAVYPNPRIKHQGRFVLSNAKTIPTSLMQRISVENDLHCRTIGRCVFGGEIDREIGSLEKPLKAHLGDLDRRFLYARYDPNLTGAGLALMGLTHLKAKDFALDDVSKISELRTIGTYYADKLDFTTDFSTFVRSMNETLALRLQSSEQNSAVDVTHVAPGAQHPFDEGGSPPEF